MYKFIETDYKYKEDWQYQHIFVCVNTFNMKRIQNFRNGNGFIEHSEDLIKAGESGWEILFRNYGFPKLIELKLKEFINEN